MDGERMACGHPWPQAFWRAPPFAFVELWQNSAQPHRLTQLIQ